jgi:glycosyltransferase involved in cell wall biosynthesis
MSITAILPVSRIQYLDRILDSLNKQTLLPTALVVVFDGPDDQFITVRNRIAEEPGYEAICLKSENDSPAHTIKDRREHIASIHNQIRETINVSGWIFSVEDDGILPPDALGRLVRAAQDRPDAGMITGVELGRWGVPYVGAWEVDDPSYPAYLTSLPSYAGEDRIEEIDACGLYCSLIRADVYQQHEFNSNNGLGPDVNLGLYARQLGYKNYIDWGVPITHLTSAGLAEIEIPATDPAKIVALRRTGNDIWSQTKY